MHIDRFGRGAGGKIDKADPAVAVHDGGELIVRSADARHVGTGGEGADLKAAAVVEAEQLLERCRIAVAVRSGGDGYHFADAFLPGQQVGVMLHMADEDHRAFLRDAAEALALPFRQHQPHQPLQLVDRTGCAVAAEEQCIPRTRIHVFSDDLPRFSVSQGHGQTRSVGIGMRVADIGPERFLQGTFDRLI
ncbi:hypothetical protein D3C73_757130 [compost metagenome]